MSPRTSVRFLVLLAAAVLADGSARSAEPPGADGPSAAPVRVRGDDGRSVRRDLTAGSVRPAEDDTLILAYADDPDTINPITASDTASEEFQRTVYETLTTPSFADPDKLLPALAERWEFDEKTLEFTIHLRKGVRWHPVQLPSGELLASREMTARDVQFSLECVMNPHIEAAHLRNYFEDPDAPDHAKVHLTVVDPYTVKIRWTKPYFLARDFTLGGFPIIPQHVFSVDETGEPISADYSSKEFAEGFNKHWANRVMCGTGPMMFRSWRRNETLELERNPDYWGRPYYFSRLVFRCIQNANTMTQEVLQNKLDFAGIQQKDQFLQIQHHAAVLSGRVKLVSYDYPGYRYIGYNMKRDLFADRRVRLALSHAVPVDQIIKYVFKDLARPIAGPFMPGSSACDPTLRPIAYDLDAARKLLDEAGWKEGPGGVREKSIHGATVRASFELMIYSEAPAYKTVAEIVKENCRKIGVDVSIAPVQWALMLQKLRKKTFDAAMLGWALGWKDDPYQVFHGSQADVPDSSNAVGYRNPEVDRLIDQLRVTLDEKKQVELYHRIDRLIYEDQPYTFLLADKATAGYDARLENVKFYKIRPCVDSSEWYSSHARILGE
jgi:ABC-type transport system substrate-binding protein